MTLNEAKEKFLYECMIRGLTKKTIKGYDDFISQFIKCVGNGEVSKLTIERVHTYAESLYSRNLSKATIGTYMRHIKVFVHWLEEMGYLKGKEVYKRIKPPSAPKKTLRIYSEEEIRLIYSCIKVKPQWLNDRNKLIISLMLDSGLRQNEVSSIRIHDFYDDYGLLKVRGKGDKERLVPLGLFSRTYLLKYIEGRPFENEILFVNRRGKPITNNTIKLLVQKMHRELGFEFSSHKLRHNYATNYCINQYEKKGMIDIYRLMILLGHSDIATTRRYLHVANQIIAKRENISQLDKIFLDGS
jgi:integrase/recombinase XerC/integrase/recombinase XerD